LTTLNRRRRNAHRALTRYRTVEHSSRSGARSRCCEVLRTSRIRKSQPRHLCGNTGACRPASELRRDAGAGRAHACALGKRRARHRCSDFFINLFETALGADEMLVASNCPRCRTHRHCFMEVAAQGDYAMMGVARRDLDAAAVHQGEPGAVQRRATPMRAAAAAQMLIGHSLSADAIARLLPSSEEISPTVLPAPRHTKPSRRRTERRASPPPARAPRKESRHEQRTDDEGQTVSVVLTSTAAATSAVEPRMLRPTSCAMNWDLPHPRRLRDGVCGACTCCTTACRRAPV